jgi:hypothetical protein
MALPVVPDKQVADPEQLDRAVGHQEDAGEHRDEAGEQRRAVAGAEHLGGRDEAEAPADQPDPRPEDQEQRQAGEIDELEAERADAAAVGEPGEAEHHEGGIGGRRIARRGDEAADRAPGEVEVLGAGGQPAAGERDHREAGGGVDEEGGPDEERAHGRGALRAGAASGRQRETVTTRMTQTTAPKASQKANAPLQRSTPAKSV